MKIRKYCPCYNNITFLIANTVLYNYYVCVVYLLFKVTASQYL